MPLLQSLLHATAFRTPLLRTLVPSVALAYGIQAAVAVPSIAAQTERFYDLSGSLTYISCTALSFFMPYLRARSTGAFAGGLSDYLSAPAPGQGLWWWRHAVLSAAVGIWATRRTHSFSLPSCDRSRPSNSAQWVPSSSSASPTMRAPTRASTRSGLRRPSSPSPSSLKRPGCRYARCPSY